MAENQTVQMCDEVRRNPNFEVRNRITKSNPLAGRSRVVAGPLCVAERLPQGDVFEMSAICAIIHIFWFIPYIPYIPCIPYIPYIPNIPYIPYISYIPYIPYIPYTHNTIGLTLQPSSTRQRARGAVPFHRIIESWRLLLKSRNSIPLRNGTKNAFHPGMHRCKCRVLQLQWYHTHHCITKICHDLPCLNARDSCNVSTDLFSPIGSIIQIVPWHKKYSPFLFCITTTTTTAKTTISHTRSLIRNYYYYYYYGCLWARLQGPSYATTLITTTTTLLLLLRLLLYYY